MTFFTVFRAIIRLRNTKGLFSYFFLNILGMALDLTIIFEFLSSFIQDTFFKLFYFRDFFLGVLIAQFTIILRAFLALVLFPVISFFALVAFFKVLAYFTIFELFLTTFTNGICTILGNTSVTSENKSLIKISQIHIGYITFFINLNRKIN